MRGATRISPPAAFLPFIIMCSVTSALSKPPTDSNYFERRSDSEVPTAGGVEDGEEGGAHVSVPSHSFGKREGKSHGSEEAHRGRLCVFALILHIC